MVRPVTSGVVLVLGGARSGKSVFAEKMVLDSGLQPLYLATAQVWDDEMRSRVDKHKSRRNPHWQTIEEPIDLPGVIEREARQGRAILVDCLTLWVTNLMLAEAPIADRFASLCAVLDKCEGLVVLVSNEVGLGIVPDNKMARDFRDHAGQLHQDVALLANKVHFIAAGLPLTLKDD
ncbi:MAG: bifunctional adenosylcobinamide kinase/adenosylcobinamide-phosphate guanylyltransferase [Pseudomonadota bacterium]